MRRCPAGGASAESAERLQVAQFRGPTRHEGERPATIEAPLQVASARDELAVQPQGSCAVALNAPWGQEGDAP
jgi:hypothetical protein